MWSKCRWITSHFTINQYIKRIRQACPVDWNMWRNLYSLSSKIKKSLFCSCLQPLAKRIDNFMPKLKNSGKRLPKRYKITGSDKFYVVTLIKVTLMKSRIDKKRKLSQKSVLMIEIMKSIKLMLPYSINITNINVGWVATVARKRRKKILSLCKWLSRSASVLFRVWNQHAVGR
jgi:ribosomal protein L35